MSRHVFNTVFNGAPVQVAHGHDHALGYFIDIVEYQVGADDDDERIIIETASFFGDYDKEQAITILKENEQHEAVRAIVLDIPY